MVFTLRNVTYKDILSIKRLHLKKGKITCIIGESGSGKSTLLRLLNKLINHDNGEIVYKNKPLEMIDSVDLRREVVMLSQTPVIFPGTIKDNLLIGLEFAEKPKVNDEKLQEVLNIVHLNKPLTADCEKLSGGEKQRVALGRVILLDPDVFLLDEPSSALDQETEEKIIIKLVEYVKRTNKTLIMVIHSKEIAQTYSENIVELKEGQIIKSKES